MLRGVRCVLGYVEMSDHFKCMAERAGPPCLIEPSILQLITKPNTEREENNVVFSPSSLQGCHRQRVLSKEKDWWVDVRHAYKGTRGSIFHQGLAHEPAYPGVLGVVRELRMSAPINTKYGEQVFQGMPDLVVLLRVEDNRPTDHGLDIPGQEDTKLFVKLIDYKTRSEIDHDLVEADRRHTEQINEYAWLVQQFLPSWLNTLSEEWEEHLFLNAGVRIPSIDEIVVDELSIVYLDMKRVRTFSSRAFLYDEGKLIGDMVDGHWRRRYPPEHEELELLPIRQFKTKDVEDLIRKGIEAQIEADQLLAPPLVLDDDVKLMCANCPVRKECISIGLQEGYSMTEQRQYEERK